MPKRYRRSPYRRRPRRFRRRSRRRFQYRRKKYDGSVKVKFEAITNCTVGAVVGTVGHTFATFHWGEYQVPAANMISLGDIGTEMNMYKPLYQFYRIRYAKCWFNPEKVTSGAANTAYRYGVRGSNTVDATILSGTQMQKVVDYRTYSSD